MDRLAESGSIYAHARASAARLAGNHQQIWLEVVTLMTLVECLSQSLSGSASAVGRAAVLTAINSQRFFLVTSFAALKETAARSVSGVSCQLFFASNAASMAFDTCSAVAPANLANT